MFSVDYDERTGIIRCSAGGFLTLDEIEQYGRAMQAAVQRAMRNFGSAALLSVPPGDAAVQKPEVMEAARDSWRRMGSGNRLAMVVPSALMRIQAARIFDSADEKVFTNEEDACNWLLEWRADASRKGAA